MVTLVSMGFGASILLVVGLFLGSVPSLSWQNWMVILWLALINTAFAFTLWNQTLRILTAVESSVLNSTMLVQIPVLAIIFLGETLTIKGWIGLLIAGCGILLVQLTRRKR